MHAIDLVARPNCVAVGRLIGPGLSVLAGAGARLLVAAVFATLLCAGSRADDSAGDMAGMAGMHDPDHDHNSSQLVLFLSAEAHHFTSSDPGEELNEDTPVIGDVLFALNRDRFRMLGEVQISNLEHDVERFQVGYEPVANTVVWLGRFHQPGSAWNTEHHHGRYLQTAVTRPSVELWEDEEGVIPQHIVGAMVDSHQPVGDHGGLQLAAGAGYGATITDEGLDPVNLLSPRFGGRHLSGSGRIGYLPEFVGVSEFGLLFEHNDLPVVNLSTAARLRADSVQQDVYGAFANWNREPWHTTAAVYDLQMDLTGLLGSRRESFLAGYVQVERQLPQQLTVYGREENSSRAGDSTYILVNHPDFELRRSTLGVRWDFWRNQALTLEAGHGQTALANGFEYRLQWSSALP